MRSPIRVLLYGIVIWFLWVSMIVVSAELLPAGIVGSALFVSLQTVALATLVLGFTILYLRGLGVGSFGEGLLVGLGWAVVMVVLDVAHSVLMPGMVPDLGAHFATVVPSYVVAPLITTATMGYLEPRVRAGTPRGSGRFPSKGGA